MKKIFLLFCISFAFVSCVWFPEDGFSEKADKLLAKDDLSDFSTLDNPIVLKKGLWTKYSLYNSDILTDNSMGNIYLLYDWKTDSFYDWTFVSKKYQNVNYGGNNLVSSEDEFFDVNANWHEIVVNVLDSHTGKFSYFRKDDEMFEVCKNTDKHILFFRQTLNQPAGFQIFDVEKKEFKPFIPLDENCSIWLQACIASDGNFWIVTNDDDYYSGNVYIQEIDVNSNTIKSPIKIYDRYKNYSQKENGDYINHDRYKPLFCDEKNIYIHRYSDYETDGNSEVLIVLNKTNGQEYEIDIPESMSYKSSIKYCAKINGVNYLIVNNYEIPGAIYSLDLENNKLDLAIDSIKCNSNTSMVIRDDKIFFFSISSKEDSYQIFNVSSNTMSEKKIIDINNMINN